MFLKKKEIIVQKRCKLIKLIYLVIIIHKLSQNIMSHKYHASVFQFEWKFKRKQGSREHKK